MLPFEEDAVLHGDRLQVAGADADERERLPGRFRLLELDAVGGPVRPEEARRCREQELLPGVGRGRIREPRVVVPAGEAVAARLLHVGDPAWQIVGGFESS